VTFYVVAMWGLWRIPNHYWGMYGNTDGMWAAWNATAIWRWSRWLDLSPFNPLSGMGSTFLPNLPWLNPAALALLLPARRGLTYLISYSLYFAEVAVSTIILFRVLGCSPVRSVLGALVYLFMLFPPSAGVVASLPWFSLAPVNAHLVAVANLSLTLVLLTGPGDARRNLTHAAALLVLAISGFVSAPMTSLTYLPAYTGAALALLWGQRPDRAALAWKVGTLVAVGAVLWGAGVVAYVSATAEMSARSTLPPPLQSRESSIALALWREAWQRFDACGRPMVLILCAKFPVFWFHVVAVAGAAIQALWGPSSLRPLAVWLLGWYTAIHAYEFVAIAGLLGPLHVISTPYLVWSSYTFFALFIVHALSAPLDLALRRRPNPAQPEPTSRWRAAHVAAAVALLLSVPAVAAYLWTTQVAPYQPPREGRNVRFLGRAPAREPIVGNITRYLIAEAQLRPGAPFRGYTVTFFGDPHGHLRSAVDYRGAGMSWDIYVRSREYLDQHYRNRFQEMDLWEFGIPTLEEYGQWISRQAHTFFTSLLASPRDVVHPLLLRVYVPDIDLLRALGVRFVISDMGVTGAGVTTVADERRPGAGPIFLHEIADPNLGTWSPTRPVVARTFDEALALLRRARALARHEVVVFSELPGPFVPVRAAELRFERGGFHVTAEGGGRALLLLPVQFSRCLRLEPAGAGPAVRLLRANALQTLLLFEGRIDARARLEAGAWGLARCRGQDAEELHALGLGRRGRT
jgi:hypothetical protein